MAKALVSTGELLGTGRHILNILLQRSSNPQYQTFVMDKTYQWSSVRKKEVLQTDQGIRNG